MTLRLLVTGGCGFIGVNLIAALQQHGGYEITVIDDESLGDRRHVEPFGVRFVPGDIRDDAKLAEALQGQHAVVHLAADTRVIDSIERPQYNFDVNVVGSFKLLEACRAHAVSRVVAASTGGAILGEVPAPVHENMVPEPAAPYGASKLAMEGYLSAFAGSYGMRCSALRFSNIYGPRSFHKGSAIAHFFKQILKNEPLVVYGDGSQVRDFLFVEDLVEGIRRALESQSTGVFQLGSGRPTSLSTLIDLIRSVTGQPDFSVCYEAFRQGELHTTWCDISKAQTAFGFDPQTQLHEGLSRTWQWFLDYSGLGAASGEGGRTTPITAAL
ncbi:MAG: NAD-dependent epimerase/dehydratase family protein [Pseudomonadota bacterium]